MRLPLFRGAECCVSLGRHHNRLQAVCASTVTAGSAWSSTLAQGALSVDVFCATAADGERIAPSGSARRATLIGKHAVRPPFRSKTSVASGDLLGSFERHLASGWTAAIRPKCPNSYWRKCGELQWRRRSRRSRKTRWCTVG